MEPGTRNLERAPRVLLLATTTGYQIRSFGEAADAIGARLVFASDRCDQLDDPWWDHAVPVRFHEERTSLDAILAACAQEPPDGVIAVGDRPTVLAAAVCAALGLPGHPPAAASASRNKLQARAAFDAAGLPTPAFRAVSLQDDPEVLARATTYPAVLKPLALSGSRGVMRVDDERNFRLAFDRLRALLQSPDIRIEQDAAHDAALIETFIPGAEYAVEGVLTRGAFTAFAIFDKPDPLDGPFFEETIYVTPSRHPAAGQQRIVETVAAAARALGLYHGPIHAECRVNDRGVYVLEVAARPIGGLCSKVLRFVDAGAAGEAGRAPTVSLEEVLLRHALGEDVSRYRREAAASAVMMVPIPHRGVYRGVHGVEEARRVAGIDDVRITAKADSVLVPLPEGRSYLGFLFAHGETPGAAERSLREAHARLRFVIDREIAVISSAAAHSPEAAPRSRRKRSLPSGG
jgi:biotin carboxylase